MLYIKYVFSTSFSRGDKFVTWNNCKSSMVWNCDYWQLRTYATFCLQFDYLMSRLLELTKTIECCVFSVLRIKKHCFVLIIFAVKVWLTQIWWGAAGRSLYAFWFFKSYCTFQELIHSLPEQQQELTPTSTTGFYCMTINTYRVTKAL